MPRALLRAKRAGKVVIGESNVGAVLSVESHLEEVGKGAAVAIGAAGAVGADRSSVNEMIAGRALCEGRNRGVTIDRFSRVHAPLRPAIGSATASRSLHSPTLIGTARDLRSQPRHAD